ncbi:MAG: glycosyltransferase [bacterium]|nr:glycosyltransferase [bacterium]
MTIGFFGTYKLDYPRQRILRKGLQQHGVAVLDCHTRERGVRKWLALWRGSRGLRGRIDLLLVGFPGHTVMPLAWVIGKRLGVPVVFDAFTSQYQALVVARRQVRPLSLRAAYYFFLDWLSCRLARVVLMDTGAHADYLARITRVPRNRFAVVFVGCDLQDFPAVPVPPKAAGNFAVHFHGHYSPFQGADIIVRAAAMLADLPVRFTLIGRGQEYPRVAALAKELKLANVEFVNDVDYPTLRGYLERADLCLGVFGPGERPVIPNKIFEAMAVGKPVLTARLPGMEELLTDRQEVVFCRANDPEDLAASIRRLFADAPLRNRLGEQARRLVAERLTPLRIGATLLSALRERGIANA